MAFFVIGGRGGKMLTCIRVAVRMCVDKGMPIAVNSELTKYRIMEEAAKQGVHIPEPVVAKPKIKPAPNITFAGEGCDKFPEWLQSHLDYRNACK